MKKRRLCQGGPEVSALGLGCMGMSEFYGSADDRESEKVILHALEQGVTMIDTADCYGNGHNERLIGRAIKKWSGEPFLATKFGIVREPGVYARKICGRPEYVRQAAEASLKRLDVDTIDLYYLHRVDQDIPIEETVGAMSDLVKEGKIRYIGLSEASPRTIAKAHAVHPVSCVQSEYSLFTRDGENSLLPYLKEQGIGFVPYSPLGRGMLTAKLTKQAIEQEGDLRKHLPRSSAENYEENMKLVSRLKERGEARNISPAQLALAWVLSRGDRIIPIPGTRKIPYLNENIGAAEITLTAEDCQILEALFPPGAAQGERYTREGMKGING
ncbi:MAG: aldo/keto reductase [Spirochaetales bacterium]|nr:aldo/keto reductase [Spirochaetales bacterium]